ncbi:hypothetical protein PhCBS80983_g00500 [Powellomyces hirtus]|uniref:DNA repair protein RAD14 n=1 Tax=Powellomyces hirtus TaxID=109895 RepID=A0A507EG27_9FUNG|nr:hypothetical protein PhCBS80983_g00500 [Powellomyces hirtus]
MSGESTLSPADLARFEQNRLAAKSRIAQARPAVVSNDAAAEPKPTSMQRKRRAIDLTYCEYNLSTMKDTKGGFLYEEQSLPDSKKQKQEERPVVYEPTIDLILENNPQCETCKSIDLDPQYLLHFKVQVCRQCKDKHPEKYSLLTKTECREDYLLTDSELRDDRLLPHWERPNPHKSTYSKMLLYLRSQVEKFAWEKWGGPEALDAEFERRESEKKERKDKKFKLKMNGRR